MRNLPPPPKKIPDLTFPTIPKIPLENGLTVLCVEDPYLPRISARLWFPVGRVADPDGSLGLSQMVIEMLKEGTSSRSSQEIAELLDQLAVDFECDLSMEHSIVSMTMLSSQLEPSLELLADLIRNPSFPEIEFDKVRTRWKGNLLSQRSDPTFLATERIFKEIYGAHPYAKKSIPLEHLDVFSCEMLRDFFLNRFTPDGAYLLMAGQLSPEQAGIVAERYFGDWRGKDRVPIEFPSLPPVPARRFALVDRPHSAQTKILTGFRTVPQSDPNVFPLKLANQVFGGSASARLFLNLREDKGYTYGAYSFQKTYQKDGLVLASADVRTDKTKDSFEEIFRESNRMGEVLAQESELTRSKSEIVGSFLRQMETPGAIGSLEVLRLLMNLPPDYYTAFLPTIRALEPRDVLTVSKQYLESRRAVNTLVGDRKLLENQIREMGEILIYDVQGNRLK